MPDDPTLAVRPQCFVGRLLGRERSNGDELRLVPKGKQKTELFSLDLMSIWTSGSDAQGNVLLEDQRRTLAQNE